MVRLFDEEAERESSDGRGGYKGALSKMVIEAENSVKKEDLATND